MIAVYGWRLHPELEADLEREYREWLAELEAEDAWAEELAARLEVAQLEHQAARYGVRSLETAVRALGIGVGA